MLKQLLQISSRNYTTISPFTDHKIVPSLLEKVPDEVLEVKYKSGKNVQLGNILTPFEVFEEPDLNWKHDANKLYTLSMVDLDLPSKEEPVLRSFQIWLVGNIPGSQIDKGDTVANYIGVGPPRNTGLHRYLMLVFEQAGKNDYFKEFEVNMTQRGSFNFMVPKLRKNFDLMKFGDKFGLGTPVAGNFFLAQYDETVRLVYKKLQYLTKLNQLYH